jgi:hypothetical protein
MIRKLKTKDLLNFQDFCSTTKTLDNPFLAKRIFNDSVKRSNHALISFEKDNIEGVLLVTGFIEKNPKKFVKLIVNDIKVADKLLEAYIWNCKTDLYIRIKKDNPIFRVLVGDNFYFQVTKKEKDNQSFLTNGFRLVEQKDGDLLLFRKYDPRFDYTIKQTFIKEDDINDNQ